MIRAAVVLIVLCGLPAVHAEDCDTCGCRGGPGFRLPDQRCASWKDHKRYCNGGCYPVGTVNEGSLVPTEHVASVPKRPPVALGVISGALPAAPALAGSAPVDSTMAEATVQSGCPSDTVVWVNTASHVYHFRGTASYGTTKKGAFLCEAAAQAEGDQAAKNEAHP